MSSVINTNIGALNAQNSLRATSLKSDNAMERLSTGVRINSAKDDAAGLAITTRMTANIRGMAAAIRNSNDGISLTQTAEGSLGAIQDNLQRIRELAVQSSNSGNSSSDRDSMNLEAQQLIAEIDRVAVNSAFNGSKLLDGTYQNQDFQVGAGNNSDDRIRISISSAKAASLGTVGTTSTSASSTSAVTTSTVLAAGDLSINGFAISASVTDNTSFKNSSASAVSKAAAINASSSLTGVTAKANALTFSAAALTVTTGVAIAAGDIVINGIDLGAINAFTPDGTNDVAMRRSQIIGAVNAKSAQTGVTALAHATAAGVIDFTSADGRNVTIATKSGVAGLTGWATLGTDIDKQATMTLTSLDGSTMKLTGGVGITASGYTPTAGAVTLTGTTQTTTGLTVSSVDLSTQTGSQKALGILDSAIGTVTNSRANLGAYQNRFAAAISNLETTSTNLQASRSRILDTDYAKETTNLAKSQIIQQAATAMLAQANQSAQSVLALLK
jgi:flagellin